MDIAAWWQGLKEPHVQSATLSQNKCLLMKVGFWGANMWFGASSNGRGRHLLCPHWQGDASLLCGELEKVGASSTDVFSVFSSYVFLFWSSFWLMDKPRFRVACPKVNNFHSHSRMPRTSNQLWSNAVHSDTLVFPVHSVLSFLGSRIQSRILHYI